MERSPELNLVSPQLFQDLGIDPRGIRANFRSADMLLFFQYIILYIISVYYYYYYYYYFIIIIIIRSGPL